MFADPTKVSGFSIPFVVMNLIGGGLSYFVANAWTNVFQSSLDEYKSDQEKKGQRVSGSRLNIYVALMATLFAVAVMYLMLRTFTIVVAITPEALTTVQR